MEIELVPREVQRGGLDAFVRIGEEVREVLERRPSSMVVVRIVRPKFVARAAAQAESTDASCVPEGCANVHASADAVLDCSPVLITEMPELPILRGLAGPGMLADTVVRRWQDHLPLHRLSLIYARDGVVLARSTMCGWHEQLADLAEPLVERANTVFVSLLASCQLHGIEPWAYLRDLFCLLPGWPKARVLELAPAFWKQTLQQPETQQRLAANVLRAVTLAEHPSAV